MEHVLLVLALVSMAALFVYQDVLWRWDNLIYDTQLSFWSRDVADDIIIIAIDDQSLNDIGHWPWPRAIHADLINRLEMESPRIIGLDIIFSEPDTNNPESDRLLSEALRNSGKVVLPVYMSQQSRNAVPIEALPLPQFTQYAATLGHVHVDLDLDGIARKIYLREGIDKPHWPHFSLAILRLLDPDFTLYTTPGETPQATSYSAMQWSRELPLLIPYAGPPGHFPSIGYSQVLKGQYPKNLFKDKIVLIGATAEGLGDALPTPFSGNGGTMAGVEIIANMIDALNKDLRIRQVPLTVLLPLTLLLVALPILLYPYLNPTHTLIFLSGFILVTALGVAMLLWFFNLWVPASGILLFQLLSYPLWSWRRLVLAMRHVNHELEQLLAQQHNLSLRGERNLADEIQFLAAFIPLAGWVVFYENGKRMLHQGNVPPKLRQPLPSATWLIKDDQRWATVDYQQQTCMIGLNLKPETTLDDDQLKLLNNLIEPARYPVIAQPHYLEDVLQTRIHQVQSVANENAALHNIINESLSSMADGVLICNGHGQVIISNRRAGWYLQGDDDATITGRTVFNSLQHVQLANNLSWMPMLQQVMLKQERAVSEAHHVSGRELMVEISPLNISDEQLPGFVINFSDISLLKANERKRSEFLNFLSHDLRSPLSSMIAMIELAKNKNRIEDLHGILQDMEKSTFKTLHLAEQFLQLSRANTTETLEFYDIDFNSIVLNAIDQLWALSNKLKVDIIPHFQHEELWIHGEPDLLERAIINLLSNALKHSSTSSKVIISVKQADHLIKCCVIDQGSGIAAADLPHLFETFRRTQNAAVDRKKGIGLGLAFVDAVARRHSGYVDVKSQPGVGSKFCLMIPIADDSLSPQPG